MPERDWPLARFPVAMPRLPFTATMEATNA
jgi:hypothetical protein